MFCKQCGSPIDLDNSAKFCSNCGFAFSNKFNGNISFVNDQNTYPGSYVKKGPSISQLRSYTQIIGIFELVIGAFMLFGSMILFLVRSVAFRNVSSMNTTSNFYAGMNVLLVLGIVLGLFALFVIISGIGLLQGKKWSKISSMIVGALAIFSFPLGTLFGCFTLYSLSRPEISQILVK